MSIGRSQKSIIVYLIFSVSIIIATSLVTVFYWPQNNMNKEIKITINHGESLSVISKKLQKNGVITNENIFEVATKIRGLDTSIPVGTFLMQNVKVNHDIINHLVFGNPERKKVTLLEGWNIKQTSNHLSKEMGFDYNTIVEIINNTSFINSLGIKSQSLEGYLYPDTYYFFEGENVNSVIKRLVKEYKYFWTDSNITKASSISLTQHQILTLASIIEGEAIYDSERPIISAVYHNRLKRGMKLQADPTVQYIIKDGPRRLLIKDLRIKSPYNTYLYEGLPPGPINSPGFKSLSAALYPDKNDYLYFVAKGDGYHTFSKNEKEHERAKRAFQRVRKKVKRDRVGS
tara:strand:+ start:125 stop:1159 length:1035 start_codon:yes stop_codon:yes gene_type:complete